MAQIPNMNWMGNEPTGSAYDVYQYYLGGGSPGGTSTPSAGGGISSLPWYQQTGGGGMFGMGNMPEMYNLVVNTNSELVNEILNTKTRKKQERLINQSLDLARLSQGLLKGKELSDFIKRSYEMIK